MEVTSDEIDVVLPHVLPCNRRGRSVEASRFLATTLWMCTEQNVTVGEPESEGRRSRPRTMSRTIPHVLLLVESSLKARQP